MCEYDENEYQLIVSTLSRTHYTVSPDLLSYLLGSTGLPPLNLAAEMERWWNDEWKNLKKPPRYLAPWMYFYCAPETATNDEILQKFRAASNNYGVAIIQDRVATGQRLPGPDEMGYLMSFPDCGHTGPQGTEFGRTDKLVDQLKSMTTAINESVTMIKRTVETMISSAKTITTDNVQSFRATMEQMLEEVRTIKDSGLSFVPPSGQPITPKLPPPRPPPPGQQGPSGSINPYARRPLKVSKAKAKPTGGTTPK